jgi:MFS family permease
MERRWQILIVLFLARSAMGFQFQSVGATAPFLIVDLHLDYAAIGSLIGLYMLPGIVIAFPGGLLSRRYGDKPVCVAGLALMLLGGAAMGIGETPSVVFAGRAVSGTGAVLFSLVLTKMATDWFAGREIVLAMGVVLASWPFGIAAGLLAQPVLAATHGWRWVMHATAALRGLALLLILAGYRAPRGAAPPAAAPGAPAIPALPPRRQMLPVLVAGAMWGNLNLALVLFFSFAPAAMAELGVGAATAAAWTGAAVWIVMFSVPLGGLAVQRSGRPDAAIAIFALLGGLALALLPTPLAPLAFGVAFGIGIGPPAGAIMALPARVLSPEHRAGGLGAFMTCYYVLVAGGPAVAGVLRQLSGTAASAMVFAAFLMASIAVLLSVFLALSRPWPRL